ncbi:hypothetical protein [Caulobacter sp. NIBR2454]|uniref:hypothetical protein n=1 Tax=Caulobacter sp. NIBR2454 TaxID=3015996 RepID=UPI0022B5E735|nr:hypothetical protein [Caulobacter sp. NIBR2454]
MPKAKRDPFVGTAVLSFRRSKEPIAFSIDGDRTLAQGKGSMTGDIEQLRAAFREGAAELALEDGRVLPIMVVAHSEGADTAYFEIRATRRGY